MERCYKCGGEIEFIHDGFNAIPIHLSGSCNGFNGGIYKSSSWHWVERETESGERFIFGWVEYPSYVNPNAKCPVCGCAVFFYQSPYGGRVFFDELGPPWPKHPCTSVGHETDHQQASRPSGPVSLDSQSSDAFRAETKIGAGSRAEDTNVLAIQQPPIPQWSKDGWSPFLVSKASATGGGFQMQGNELLSNGGGTPRGLVQQSISDSFRESKGSLEFGYLLAMNGNRLLTVLLENVVMIRWKKDLVAEISTIAISKDNEITTYFLELVSV